MELALESWQVVVGAFLLLMLFTIWTTISTRRGMHPVGPAGSLEAQAGRGAIEGTIGCLGFALGVVVLLGGVYVALRQPALPVPQVRLQMAMPTATPIVEGRLRPGLHVEVVTPRLVPMYAANTLGKPTEAVVLVAGNGLVGVINGGPDECGGAICWRVQLANGHQGWLVERLPEGARVLAAVP
ncbi:MAG: hypothetical protein KIS91_07395 [Anaerolineae bacterium]|jgi:hypothetical protein|nr:hypothetical protein [Anaerolineae bacterium]